MAEQRRSLIAAEGKLSIARIVDELRRQREWGECIAHVEHYPAQDAQWADFPKSVPAEVQEIFNRRGIERLYVHQAEAIEAVLKRKNVVVVTPTASGKTLCYNLPVLNTIILKS